MLALGGRAGRGGLEGRRRRGLLGFGAGYRSRKHSAARAEGANRQAEPGLARGAHSGIRPIAKMSAWIWRVSVHMGKSQGGLCLLASHITAVSPSGTV